MNKKYNKSPNNKAKWMNNKKRPNKICNLNNLRQLFNQQVYIKMDTIDKFKLLINQRLLNL